MGRKYDPEYYQRNKERLKADQRRWREKNREVAREKSRKWYSENKDRARIKHKEIRKRHKIKFIKMLGGECERCGEDNILVLQFHHKNGRKKDDVKTWWQRPLKFIKLIEGGEINLFCANCHIIEHNPDY